MKYIVKVGNMYVSNADFNRDYREDGAIAKLITLSTEEIGSFDYSKAYAINISLKYSGVKSEMQKIKSDNNSYTLHLIDFLRERDNKLQKIEQLFKKDVVDLAELAEIVKEGK